MQQENGVGKQDAAVEGDGLVEELAARIASAEETGGSVSVAVIDIDEFDKVNTEHDTDAGDAVLASTAEFLSRVAEAGAGTAHKIVFRHGGDEFALVLPGMEKEDAFLMMERARADFAATRPVGRGGKALDIPLTMSAAVATYPEDGARAQEVLRKAVDAIYRAKTTGRNRVCLGREERMVTKTSHYTQPQLARLTLLSKRDGIGEAVLLREALDDLLRRYGV